MHPDKNRDMSPNSAKEAFQEIQQAYEVLSDPQVNVIFNNDYHFCGLVQQVHELVQQVHELEIGMC